MFVCEFETFVTVFSTSTRPLEPNFGMKVCIAVLCVPRWLIFDSLSGCFKILIFRIFRNARKNSMELYIWIYKDQWFIKENSKGYPLLWRLCFLTSWGCTRACSLFWLYDDCIVGYVIINIGFVDNCMKIVLFILLMIIIVFLMFV